MKSEKLMDAIGIIGDDLIAGAKKKNNSKRKPLLAGIAAMLILVLGFSAVWGRLFPSTQISMPPDPPTTPSGVDTIAPSSPGNLGLQNLIAAPTYPQVAQYSNEQYDLWKEFQIHWETLYGLPDGYLNNLKDFFAESAVQCLSGEGNQVYSPSSVYFSLAMLAECTDGNSQKEILKLLGVTNIEQLRSQAKRLWLASYKADGKTSCIFSNSVWIDDQLSYNTETAQYLADQHYASVFHGDLGTTQMNEQLQTWLNAMTGNLLYDQANAVQMDSSTALALVSTLYFQANWKDPFLEKNTYTGIFHSSRGETQVQFLFADGSQGASDYFWSEQYTAVCRPLADEQNLWLILPNEGCTPKMLLQDDQWLTMVLNKEKWQQQKHTNLELSVPKFDICSRMDLIESLKKLGITNIFDGKTANFSPITSDANIRVQEFDQATRVLIDEFGVSGASYARPFIYFSTAEVKLTLDRPFLFVITTADGLPLFVGIVEQP